MRVRVLVAAILAILPGVAAAQSSPQTVQYQVTAINVVAVTGAPTLIVSAAVPGSPPTPATSSGLTWAVTTNQSTARVTARINLAMPAGTSLTLNLGAPAGATSAGTKTLTTTAQDMVTGITRVAQGGMAITYVFTAAVTVGPTSGTRTVTYTITGGV